MPISIFFKILLFYLPISKKKKKKIIQIQFYNNEMNVLKTNSRTVCPQNDSSLQLRSAGPY